MSTFVSVKIGAIGRTQSFLPASNGDVPAPQPGDAVIVQTDQGQAIGTVVSIPPQLEEKRRPAAGTTNQVVRRATREDIVARMRQSQREREAQTVATLKIRERGLGMRLARVE